MEWIDVPQDRDSLKCLTQKEKALQSFERSGVCTHMPEDGTVVNFLSVRRC